jgi:hypothetical protein
MKIKHLLLLGVVAAFSSCSTAYRTGQTPDDVYYSPAPQENTYVSRVTEQDKNSYSYRNQEDANIRRGINDPVYRNAITFSTGMGYGYSPYSMFPYNSFNNPFYGNNGYGYNGYGYNSYGMKGMYDPYYNSLGYNNLNFYSSPYGYYNSNSLGYGYSPYNYGYSPYYAPVLFSHQNVNTNTGARRYNLNVYNNNPSANSGSGGNVQPIRTTPSGTTGVGNVIRRVFTPSQRSTYSPPANNSNSNNRRTYNNNNSDNNNRNNTYETPQRTFTPSTPSNSQPSSSESGNSAPVRTFRR